MSTDDREREHACLERPLSGAEGACYAPAAGAGLVRYITRAVFTGGDRAIRFAVLDLDVDERLRKLLAREEDLRAAEELGPEWDKAIKEYWKRCEVALQWERRSVKVEAGERERKEILGRRLRR